MHSNVKALVARMKENVPDIEGRIVGATDAEVVRLCADECGAVPPAHLPTNDAAQWVLAKIVADNQ